MSAKKVTQGRDTLKKPKRSDGTSFKKRPPKRGLTRKTIEKALMRIGL